MKIRALLFWLVALVALSSPPAIADKYPSVYPTLAAIPCSTEIACSNIAHVQISAATTFGTAGLVSYDWHAVGDGLCGTNYYRPSGSATGCFVATQINANSITGFSNAFVPLLRLGTIGDSIIQGVPSATSVAFYVNQQTGVLTINDGIGGQKSTQIAMRFGGVATRLTLGSNQLVSGSNSVTQINGAAILGMSTAQNPDYRLLSTPATNGEEYIFGTICGHRGKLDRFGSGATPSTSEAYTFTPDSSVGLPVSCAASSTFVVDNGANYRYQAVFEGGGNNYNDPTSVKADIMSMVSLFGPTSPTHNYIYEGITSGVGAECGTATRAYIDDENAYFKAQMGSHFYDYQAYLASPITIAGSTTTQALWDLGIAPTSQDLLDIGNCIVPSSLRVDTTHPTAALNQKTAQRYVNMFSITGHFANINIGDAPGTAPFDFHPVPGAGEIQFDENGNIWGGQIGGQFTITPGPWANRKLVLNGDSELILNLNSGSIIRFGDGANNTAGYIDLGANITMPGRGTFAHVTVADISSASGNLILNPVSSIILAYSSGNGTSFGNGASGTPPASIDTAGNFTTTGYGHFGAISGPIGDVSPNTGVFSRVTLPSGDYIKQWNSDNTDYSVIINDGGTGTSRLRLQTDVTALTLLGSGEADFYGDVKVGSGANLWLGSTFVSGAPTATGYVTLKDASGTTYKVLVAP